MALVLTAGVIPVQKAEAATWGVELGTPSFSGSTFTFSGATLTCEGSVTSMAVNVTAGYIITGGYKIADNQTYHQTATWIWSGGKSKSEAEAFLRSIQFSYREGMEVTVTIDGNEMQIPESGSTITAFTPAGESSPHYYMYVPFVYSASFVKGVDDSWMYAYGKAREWTYMGLRGYLVTITSDEENAVLDKINNFGAWAGGARLTTASINNGLDKAGTDTYISTGKNSGYGTYWVWVCGPESGQYISLSPSSVAGKAGVNNYGASVGYSKWSSNQPDGGGSTDEYVLQVHHNNQPTWNDLPITYPTLVDGYFVEFSYYSSSQTGGLNGYVSGYSSTKSASDSITIGHHMNYRGEGNTLYAYCDASIDAAVCDCHGSDNAIALSLVTPDAGYTGAAYSAVSLSGLSAFNTATHKSVSTNDIKYYSLAAGGKETLLSKVPSSSGKYKAKLTVEGYTLESSFEITFAIPAGFPSDPSFTSDNVEITTSPVKTVILKDDITLTGPITLGSGETFIIDLNGHTMTGAPGEPVIEATGGRTTVTVTDSSEKGGGVIKSSPGETAGADGADTIDFTNAGSSSRVVIENGATVSGGNGSDGSAEHPNGGRGGAGVQTGSNTTVTVNEGGAVVGGTGGGAYPERADSEAGEPGEGGLPVMTGDEEADDSRIGGDGDVEYGDEGGTAEINPRYVTDSGINYSDGYIHYNNPDREHVRMPARRDDENGEIIEGSYLDLTDETLVTDLAYDCYSLNGGRKWTTVSKPLTSEEIGKWFSVSREIMIAKGYDTKTRLPMDDATVYYFGTTAKRQSLSTVKVEYFSDRDEYGITNGQWNITAQGAFGVGDMGNYEFLIVSDKGLEMGWDDAAGKRIESTSGLTYGTWPEKGGVWVPSMESGKPFKVTVMIRVAAGCDEDGLYHPSSAPKKLNVSSVQKAPNLKVNYSKETIKIKKGMSVFFGEAIPGAEEYKPWFFMMPDNPETYGDYAGSAIIAAKPEVANRPVSLSLYLTETRNTILLWQTATSSKPASVKQTLKLAARSEITKETELTCSKGKISAVQLKKYEIYDPSSGKWSSRLPAVSGDAMFDIRLKCTAKPGKENDSTFAAGITGTLSITWGEWDTVKNKSGIVKATIGPYIEHDDEEELPPEEELDAEVPETPQGAPDAGEDTLPETGAPAAVVYFAAGLALASVGILMIKKN